MVDTFSLVQIIDSMQDLLPEHFSFDEIARDVTTNDLRSVFSKIQASESDKEQWIESFSGVFATGDDSGYYIAWVHVEDLEGLIFNNCQMKTHTVFNELGLFVFGRDESCVLLAVHVSSGKVLWVEDNTIPEGSDLQAVLNSDACYNQWPSMEAFFADVRSDPDGP